MSERSFICRSPSLSLPPEPSPAPAPPSVEKLSSMKPVPVPKRLGTAVLAHSYELPRVIGSVESEHGMMAARAGRGRGAA